MSEDLTTTQATIAVESTGEAAGSPHQSVIEPSGQMVLMTWLMFGITAVILYKIAWKPILAALDKRENDIKSALDNAEKARQQAEETKAQCEQMINQADAQARELVEQARKAARETAESISNQAREESKVILANAQREIAFEKEKAIDALRQESAHLAIEIAGKLIRKNLDSKENRALTDEWLQKL
jgi:F-type H+-transporting ATPase subunit b